MNKLHFQVLLILSEKIYVALCFAIAPFEIVRIDCNFHVSIIPSENVYTSFFYVVTPLKLWD